MTGISRLRAWLSAKVRAGMGILVRQDNICMAMAERSENGRAELVWQEEYVRGNDEGVEDFWARAALGGLRSCPEEGECYLVLEGQEVFFYEKQFPDMADRELQQSLRLDFAAASGWHRSFAFGYERLADGRFRLGGMHEKIIAFVVLEAYDVGDAGCHRTCGNARRTDERIDFAFGDDVQKFADEKPANSCKNEACKAEDYDEQSLCREEGCADCGCTDGDAEEQRDDVHKCVLCGVAQTLGNSALTQEVAEHKTTEKRSNGRQEQ